MSNYITADNLTFTTDKISECRSKGLEIKNH